MNAVGPSPGRRPAPARSLPSRDMRRLALLLSLTGLLGAVAAAGAGPASATTPLPAQWQKGLNVTAFWWSDLSGKTFRTWLQRARTRAHADTVTFVVTWYQPTLGSTKIAPSYGTKRSCGDVGDRWTRCKTPSMAALRAAIRAAKAQGLKVGIRPQVDVGTRSANARPREQIDLRGDKRKAWFKSYSNLLSQYARLARDTGSDALVVGADLSGMTNEPADLDYWRHLVDDTRSGKLLGDGGGFTKELTYAMTWKEALLEAADPAVHRFVWDTLNATGIDAYFPLVSVKAPHDDPSVAVLRDGWADAVAAVRAIHAEYDKPVTLTGLGYLSRLGTSVAPDNGDAQQAANGGRLSQTAQSRPVQAAFDVWSAVGSGADGSWFQGIWWWEWPASGRGGPKDGSHSLEGKRAQAVVCRRHVGNDTASCPIR